MTGERLTSPGLVLSHGCERAVDRTERTDAAVTNDTHLHQLLRALVRFWWIAIVGIVLAVLVFVLATYKVSAGLPPSFEARAQSTYTASTQVLITSKREPYLSATNVNAKIIPLPNDTSATGTTGTAGTPTSTYDSGSGADGDLQRLVEIANDLPPRVTSDPVIKLRNRLYRRIQGSVTAVNPYAFSGAGGFRSGPLPYIKITGTANSKQDALDITNSTALAFKRWFEGRQAAARIKSADRVLVEQVNSADTAFPQGGSKPLLGVAAALLVLLGVAGLVLALDRLIPYTPKPRRSAATEPRERPAPESTEPERVEPVRAPTDRPAPAPEIPLVVAQLDPKPVDPKPVDRKPFDPQPLVRAEPVERKPVGPQPFEVKPVEAKPADAQTFEAEPIEAKAADAQPVEAKPIEAKPTDAQPVEAKPVEANPIEAKPADAQPIEAKPVEAKPVALPPLEVPTMTFGARIEDAANGDTPANREVTANGDLPAASDDPATAAKPTKQPTPRPRRSTSNGSAAPRRRRTTTSSPKNAPNTDDAS
jgi:hypothetical protein